MHFRPLAAAATLCALMACSGGDGEAGAATDQDDGPAPGAEAAPPPAEGPPTGPIDQGLATRGETLFQTKGCIGCHTIGDGRLTGPDLQGVVERREYGWIMAMVTNPDSMLREDATARQLFAEYMTPMVNMGVTRDEARALYEYLRSRSEETAPGG